MGFQRSTLKLKFPADSEFAGLEVSLRRVTIGQIEDMEELIEQAENKKLSAKEAFRLCRLMAEFMAPFLLGWNYTDLDDNPIPPTLDGIRNNVDLPMMLDLFVGWMDAASGVDADLKEQSMNGESPLPPENLNTSLANWQELEESLLSASDSDVSQAS